MHVYAYSLNPIGKLISLVIYNHDFDISESFGRHCRSQILSHKDGLVLCIPSDTVERVSYFTISKYIKRNICLGFKKNVGLAVTGCSSTFWFILGRNSPKVYVKFSIFLEKPLSYTSNTDLSLKLS